MKRATGLFYYKDVRSFLTQINVITSVGSCSEIIIYFTASGILNQIMHHLGRITQQVLNPTGLNFAKNENMNF